MSALSNHPYDFARLKVARQDVATPPSQSSTWPDTCLRETSKPQVTAIGAYPMLAAAQRSIQGADLAGLRLSATGTEYRIFFLKSPPRPDQFRASNAPRKLESIIPDSQIEETINGMHCHRGPNCNRLSKLSGHYFRRRVAPARMETIREIFEAVGHCDARYALGYRLDYHNHSGIPVCWIWDGRPSELVVPPSPVLPEYIGAMRGPWTDSLTARRTKPIGLYASKCPSPDRNAYSKRGD